MLAEDGEIIADDEANVSFDADRVEVDNKTDKRVAMSTLDPQYGPNGRG
jgi:hypothetical protein